MSLFLTASPSAFLNPSAHACPTCKKRVYVCHLCYRALARGGSNVSHKNACQASAHANKTALHRYRNAATGAWRAGNPKPPRTEALIGAAPHHELVRSETTLVHTLPPTAYRSSFVRGRTRVSDESYQHILPRRGLVSSEDNLWHVLKCVLENCGGSLVCELHKLKKGSSTDTWLIKKGKPTLVDTMEMFDHLRNDATVYVTIAIDNMTEDKFVEMMRFAPVPPVLVGFLFRRVYLFVSKVTSPGSITLYPHRDSGSGPLVYAAGSQGGMTTAALMTPTNSQPPPHALGTAFDDSTASADVHFVNLHRRGEFLCIPSGWWHSVQSEGARICVAYFDHTVNKS